MAMTDYSSYPAATIFNSHVRKLARRGGGIDYTISIWLPQSYAVGQQAYPVVYLLDGNFAFGLATDTTHILMEDHEVPDVIIVGIGYDIATYEDWLNYRNRDFIPTPDPDIPGSGGAPEFLEFIENELVPLIDANYRTDPTNRTLWGYSFGGSFVLYALLKRPGLFQRNVAGSPWLGWEDRAMFNYEAELAAGRTALPVTLAIFVGELETQFRPHIEAFANVLRSRQYQGLQIKTFVQEGESHLSGVASTYVRGLKAVLGRQS